MGTTESTLMEADASAGTVSTATTMTSEMGSPSTASPPQQLKRPRPGPGPVKRVKPPGNSPPPPRLQLNGIVTGLSGSGKRTLLQILTGQDPSGPSTTPSQVLSLDPQPSEQTKPAHIFVPYQTHARTWDRIALSVQSVESLSDAVQPPPSSHDSSASVTAPSPSSVDFVVILINPQSKPKKLQSFVRKTVRQWMRRQGYSKETSTNHESTDMILPKPLCLCCLINFWDLQHSAPQAPTTNNNNSQDETSTTHPLESELSSLVMETILDYDQVDPQWLVLQMEVTSLLQCCGLDRLHHFIYQSYLLRKQWDLQSMMHQVRQQQAHTNTLPPRESYAAFLQRTQATSSRQQRRPLAPPSTIRRSQQPKSLPTSSSPTSREDPSNTANKPQESSTPQPRSAIIPPESTTVTTPNSRMALDTFFGDDDDDQEEESNGQRLRRSSRNPVVLDSDDEDDDEFFVAGPSSHDDEDDGGQDSPNLAATTTKADNDTNNSVDKSPSSTNENPDDSSDLASKNGVTPPTSTQNSSPPTTKEETVDSPKPPNDKEGDDSVVKDESLQADESLVKDNGIGDDEGKPTKSQEVVQAVKHDTQGKDNAIGGGDDKQTNNRDKLQPMKKGTEVKDDAGERNSNRVTEEVVEGSVEDGQSTEEAKSLISKSEEKISHNEQLNDSKEASLSEGEDGDTLGAKNSFDHDREPSGSQPVSKSNSRESLKSTHYTDESDDDEYFIDSKSNGHRGAASNPLANGSAEKADDSDEDEEFFISGSGGEQSVVADEDSSAEKLDGKEPDHDTNGRGVPLDEKDSREGDTNTTIEDSARAPPSGDPLAKKASTTQSTPATTQSSALSSAALAAIAAAQREAELMLASSGNHDVDQDAIDRAARKERKAEKKKRKELKKEKKSKKSKSKELGT